MKRRYFYFLTLIFLSGLFALDYYTARATPQLERLLRQEMKRVLRAQSSARVRIVSLTQVEITDIEISRDPSSDEHILTCDSVLVTLDWFSLLRGSVKIKELKFTEPELHLFWEDGELSLSRVFATQDNDDMGSTVIPHISVEGLVVNFHNAPFWAQESVTIGGVDIHISPNILKSYPYRLAGKIDDAAFGRFDLEGAFGGAKIRGKIEHDSFRLEPAVLNHLHEPLRTQLSKVTLDGGSIALKVSFEAEDVLDRINYLAVADVSNVAVGYRDWPIGITELSGRLELQDLRIDSTDLKFKLAGAQVRVKSAEVDLGGVDTEFRINGRMTKLHVDEKFINDLEELRVPPFDDVSEALEALGAHGDVDVAFDLTQDSDDDFDGVKVEIVAEFREADLMYRGFYDKNHERVGYPYPLRKVVGSVHIGNNGLEFRDLRSTVRSPDLIANGTVSYGQAAFGYDIDIRGFDVRLDEKVRQTLPPDEREIFDSYSPSGPVDFSLKINRPGGRQGSPDLLLDVNLKGCTAVPQLFPYRLEDLRGHLIFGDVAGTKIRGVTARHDVARFNVEGLLDHRHEAHIDDPAYDLEIKVEDLQVNDDLLTGLSAEFPDIASELRRYDFSGTVDFNCSITSRGEGEQNTYQADLKGLSFCYEKFPNATCTDLVGQVLVQGNRLEFNRTTFQLSNNEMEAAGWLNIGEELGHDIRISSKDFAITEQAIRIAIDAAPSVREIDDVLDITGSVSLSLRLRSGPEGELFRTSLTAQGLTIAVPDYKVAAERVYGTMTIEGDDIDFEGWTGVIPYAQVGPDAPELVFSVNSGHYRVKDDGGLLNLHHIGFANLVLDERLWQKLPEEIALELEDWKLEGSLSGRIDSLLFAGDKVRFRGQIEPNNVRMDPGVPFELNHGTIFIEDARADDNGFDLEGRLEDSDLLIQGFPVTSSSAIFQLDHNSFAFRNFAGDCLDGKINPRQSYFVLDHGDTGYFESSLSLKKLDLSRFAKVMGGSADDVIGKADGWAHMEGILADHATFKGEGEIWFTGEKLYDLPVLASILQFVNFDFLIRGGGQEQLAHFNAKIENEKILIENARFEGPGIALDGGGVVGFDGVAQLEFTPTIIKLLDGIPVLGDIVNVVTGFLVSKIKVTGPMEDLRADGDNYLTELLPGEKDTGRRLKTRPLKVDNRK